MRGAAPTLALGACNSGYAPNLAIRYCARVVPRVFRVIPALCAVLFALFAFASCGGIPDNAVLQVDGTPITKSAFNHWMGVAAVSSSGGLARTSKPVVPEPPQYTACVEHLKATTPKPIKGQPETTTAQFKAQCETQYKTLQGEVLGFLISSQWVLGEAGSLGVSVSDKEVKKRFEQIRNQQFPKAAEFERFLANSGQSVSDLLLRVKLNLMSSKIQQKVVRSKSTVTKKQVEKFYNENPARFGVPERRDLEIILTKTEAQAAKAKAEVASGKSFASVAKRVSIDPTSKSNGGLLPGVVKGQEEKSLDSAVFAAKANVLEGPVKTPFGVYVFRVKAITAGSKQSLAQSEASIKQQLMATHQQAALTEFVKKFKEKWKAKTDCRSSFVVMDCKQYKAPKTPVLPSAPVTPQTTPPPVQTTTAPATTTKK
jgi:foldase protein PrsA